MKRWNNRVRKRQREGMGGDKGGRGPRREVKMRYAQVLSQLREAFDADVEILGAQYTRTSALS